MIASRKPHRHRFRKYWVLYTMFIPGIIYFLLNNYIPMFGIIIAFKNLNFQKGLFGSDWVAFENFEYLFKTRDAFVITRNTLLYNLAFIIVNTIIAVIIAIILSELLSKGLVKFYQTSILLPNLISMIIVSYIVYGLLNADTGFINKSIMMPLGFGKIAWYSEAKYWPFILIVVNCWKHVGYLAIVYLASVLGIDREIYEAARIDGASKMCQIKYITIPLIKPTIILMALMSIGRIFYSDFGLFYQVPLNSGAIYSVTNTIETYVYRGLLQLGDIGMAAAAGVYQSFVGFLIVILSNLTVRKLSNENALF